MTSKPYQLHDISGEPILIGYDVNQAGTDYVVGDIHGCFSALEDALKIIEFNPSIDRLFCTGDLVDRGPESKRCLEFLDKPWFFSVRGNHDDMLSQWLFEESEGYYHGAHWFYELTEAEQIEYSMRMQKLPYIIQVLAPENVVYIVHGLCTPGDIGPETLTHVHDNPDCYSTAVIKNNWLWSRPCLSMKLRGPDKISRNVFVHGHSIMNSPKKYGKHVFLDTGAFITGTFGFLNLKTMEILHIDTRN